MQVDVDRFRFIADALHGVGGFRPVSDGTQVSGDTYLVRYPRESDEKFARRNQVAWYANDLASACSRFAGYLSRKPPQRDLQGNPLLTALADDADWQGNALDVFWSRFTTEAKARGAMLLLVDMPRDLGRSLADQLTERSMPYLAMIHPEQVTTLTLDDHNRIELVEIDGGIQEGKQIFRGWDTERWWVRAGEVMIEQGDHPLGVCPVLGFAESTFPRPGEFAQIADLSKRLFNLRSELDEILRAQTFSLLTYQVPADLSYTFDPETLAGQIGTNNMLVHNGATPTFIAPPEGPARIYLDVIAQLEEKIRRIGHVVEAPDRAESGVALQIRFQQLNSALAYWARTMEDLERRMWDVACKWLGLSVVPDVRWDDDYAITDLASELNVLTAMQQTGFSDQTLTAKRQQIVAIDFATADDAELSALIEAEGEVIHEREVDGFQKAPSVEDDA